METVEPFVRGGRLFHPERDKNPQAPRRVYVAACDAMGTVIGYEETCTGHEYFAVQIDEGDIVYLDEGEVASLIHIS